MKVSEFTSYDLFGCMYTVVNASLPGYVSNPEVLIEADRNVVKQLYGNCELKGFAPRTKKSVFLYIIPSENQGTFIDGVISYLKETDTKIELPDWATKALADKMSKDITNIKINGDSVDVTSKVNGKETTYNVNKNGKVTEK